MKKIIFATLLLATYSLGAQSFEWLKTPEASITLNPDMIGYCTTTDASGNLYFAGFKDTPTPYNDIMGHVYFNKYNPGGTPVFEKIIEGKAQVYNMVTDIDGNIVVAFGWLNTITIDELTLNTVNQGMQFLLAKFDANGQLLWNRQMVINAPPGTGLDEIQEFRAITLDNQGNIYTGYSNYIDCYITKYNSDGGELFTITQTDVSRISSLAIDTEGNILASGGCIDWTAAFAGVTVEPNMLYNDYVVKYSSSGQFKWIKIIESITCSETHVVAKGPDEIYMCGSLYGAFAFDNFTTEGDVNANGDFYLAKLNAQGAFQWVREAPQGASLMLGYRNFLTIDNQGNTYISGRASANIDWGNGIVSGGEGLYKTALVLKYNQQGNPIMAKTATSDFFTRFDGVSVTNEGDIYVAGVGFGSATFDDITYAPQQTDEYYPFAAKIGNAPAGLPSDESKTISIYPNPANDVLYINGIGGTISGSIYSVTGQKVKDFESGEAQGIPISDLSSGVYIFRVEEKVLKFIKQ